VARGAPLQSGDESTTSPSAITSLDDLELIAVLIPSVLRPECSGASRVLVPARTVREALRGPFGPGVAVYLTLIDTRKKPRIYASSCNAFFGMKLLASTDLRKKFKETKSAPAFPKDDGRALANIWSLEPGDNSRELWCGTEPAALFRSGDAGDSWEMVPGISNHEHARQWQPGNGGLCMHTIAMPWISMT